MNLWVLVAQCYLISISHQFSHQKRRCVFNVTETDNHGYVTAGNVSGSVQICENTHCCLAIYQIINGEPEVETLACEKVDKFCPNATCIGKPHFGNRFIKCVCSKDLCNSNLTLTSNPKQPPQMQFYYAAEIPKTAAVILFIIGVGIVAIKWIKVKTKMENKNKEEKLQSSSHDYKSQQSCSCQTKMSENNITDIELQEVVGRGDFATVFQATYNKTVVAVKVYPAAWKDKFTTEKEIYELPLLNHRGIVQFLGTGRKPDDGSCFMVLEHAKHGSLYSFLCEHTTSWMLSMKLCQSLSEGLSYLHSDLLSHGVHKPPVAHRDLSSFNVLVKADGSCALCDFGSSTILRSCSGHHFWQQHLINMKCQAQFGMLHYMSPELLEGSVNLSSSSFLLQGDIYSLSLILWEIWMRCSDLFEGGIVPQHLLPYELELETNVTLDRLVPFVSEMDKRPSVPEYWASLPQGSALIELLMDCWDRDTDARLTAPCVVDRLASFQSSYSQ